MNSYFKLIFVFVILMVLLPSTVLASSIASYYFNTSSENDTTLTSNNVVMASSVMIVVTTDKTTSCKYSATKGVPYDSMEGFFDLNLGTVHKKTFTDLTDGIYKNYIKCKDDYGNESKELEAVFSVSVPVSAQIVLPKGSPVSAGRVEIKLVSSKILSQTPSLSYSFDGISYNPIPLFGSGTQWTGYLIIPHSSEEEKVGSFKFQGRDLEGNIGTKITSGGVFLVDTTKPETITNIKAEGYQGLIKLSWYFESSDDVKEFNIYRSTSQNVDYSDFYKSVSGKSFSDTSVEKGKTYYYRVSAVDDAGNEGDLSPEVYATALLKNITVSPSGLEPRFLGIVDNLVSEINSVLESSNAIKNNFDLKEEKEKEIYSNLKLSREIDNANLELRNLMKEVENFKSQSLTREELDKKLSSSKLKLNTIKRKIPESIIVTSEKTETKETNENDITSIILEVNPAMTEKLIKKSLEKSLDTINKNGFSVKTTGYNIEIVYLDGTRKDVSLVKESISSQLSKNSNISIIEVIPKEIAENALNLDIKNIDYNVLKDDPIISFASDTKEIIYSVDKHIDLKLISNLKTSILYEVKEDKKSSSITGYFALSNFKKNENYLGIGIGILISVGLGFYFLFIKRAAKLSENLFSLRERITEAEKELSEENLNTAEEIYNSLSKDYKALNKKEKKAVYNELDSLYKKIKSFKKIKK